MTDRTTAAFIALQGSLRIVHHVPGRLRVRISRQALQLSNSESIDDIRRFVEDVHGVRRCRISPLTFSAVVEYDQKIIAPSILDDLFQTSEPAARAALETLTASGTSGGASNNVIREEW